jgi:hypothetical protein
MRVVLRAGQQWPALACSPFKGKPRPGERSISCGENISIMAQMAHSFFSFSANDKNECASDDT